MAKSNREVYTWEEIVNSEEQKVDFLVEPYIVREGTTILHGKYSLGKSPLTWYLGLAVASGKSVFGLNVTQAQVLYLEVDTSGVSVRPRMKLLEDEFSPPLPMEVGFFNGGFDILNPKPETIRKLRELQERLNPELVIVNTLRKVFHASANDSEVPSKVYGAFMRFFPGSAFLFVHHDRKHMKDGPVGVDDESISGSLAWVNDAQIGLHLTRYGRGNDRVKLSHTKSQVSDITPGMILKLAEDGSHMRALKDASIEQTFNIIKSLPTGLRAKDQDRAIADMLKCSARQARRKRTEVERWLEKGGSDADGSDSD